MTEHPSDAPGAGGLEVPAETGEEAPPDDAVQENLLDRLLYKGILPRYAFPTDVATFYVFDQNKSSYRPAFRYAPSQGLPIALSQYAPGKEVWIANKRYTSGAIYSPIKGDRVQAWHSKRLYYECKRCHYACTKNLQEGHKGERLDCPACGEGSAFGEAKYWFRPPGFAHPVYIEEGTSPDDEPARSYATRAKLDAPTPGPGDTSWVSVSGGARVFYFREHLLVTNTGPRSEGYNYCTICGVIEPTARSAGVLGRPHPKPYPDTRNPVCKSGGTTTGICLGTDFITDVLLVSLGVSPPLSVMPGLLATDIALRTACEALAKAACQLFELETNEIQAEYRAAMTPAGRDGLEAELYLYDTLPGGAGFSRRVGEHSLEVFRVAIALLEGCDCELSCYKCLRSYKNKLEHARLDRHVGGDLMRYVLDDTTPELPSARLKSAMQMLAQDLQRQAGTVLRVSVDASLKVPGIGDARVPIHVVHQDGRERVVAVTHPLTPRSSTDKSVASLSEYTSVPVLLLPELQVRKNLPSATRAVLSSLGLA